MSELSPEQLSKARELVSKYSKSFEDGGQVSIYKPLEIDKDSFGNFISGKANVNLENIMQSLVKQGFDLVPLGSTVCPPGHMAVCKTSYAGDLQDAILGKLSKAIAAEKVGAPIQGKKIMRILCDAIENGELSHDD